MDTKIEYCNCEDSFLICKGEIETLQCTICDKPPLALKKILELKVKLRKGGLSAQALLSTEKRKKNAKKAWRTRRAKEKTKEKQQNA